ncbi:AEC family transporter [Helicovermis profundi]|uniref:AEC family transporter n=1 Tax=Helicovermis profundi TaxID=3065157 RepID=A0AAU9E7W1_9FIRM|nr:AEC family transporter [Clostridia bacterium S502]
MNPQFSLISNQIMLLFLLIISGFVIKKLKVVTNNINKEISSLVINVTLPAFIITSMNQKFTPEILKNSAYIVGISYAVYLFAIIFSKIYTKVTKANGRKKDVFEYILIFANVGYMGYPVVSIALGDIGVFYAAIYNLAFNVLTWTYGVYLMTRGSDKGVGKRSILNPGLVALIIGFILFLFSLNLPTPIYKTLKLIGSTTTPLSMMFIGFILADVHYKEIITDISCIVLSIFRLIVLPLTVLFVLKLFGFSGYLLTIPVLMTAMPAAANTSILASRYDNDFKLASKATFISTLFSVITIPIILGLVM